MRSMRGNTNAYVAVGILAVVAIIIGISLVVWNHNNTQHQECVDSWVKQSVETMPGVPIEVAKQTGDTMCNSGTWTEES